MNEKKIILTARIVSLIFRPFYLPLVGVIALFIFSYLSMFPAAVKAIALLIVYILTVLLPTLLIHSYRTYHGWTPKQLGVKERRMVPYVISILCYFTCFYLMNVLHMPYFLNSILIAALSIQVLCAIVNVFWKISTHSAAIGGVAGALIAFSLIFNFNPVWWLCLVIFIGGLVGTSRMILRQHTLSQVSAGFFLGLISTFAVILLL